MHGVPHPPAFTAPAVRAVMTTRSGGVSSAPYDSLNLGLHVGDDPDAVATNRARLAARLGMPTQRLVQVHGRDVVRLGQPAETDAILTADACISTATDVGCEIQVADCLPVLFADVDGRVVGAAHAGWRGLAAGVLEATVDAMTLAAGVAPHAVEAWLGPCIGAARFEVGDDVLRAFETSMPDARMWFAPGAAGAPGKWWADLAGLARARLQRIGIQRLSGNDGSPDWCTVSNASTFFSFRRERVTGRMAAAIGLVE